MTLKVFCDLAETHSFTKAGLINGMTQSGASQHIRMLERKFATVFIEQGTKALRLTREGHVLYDCAKRILRLQESMYNTMQGKEHSIAGTIRVSTIYSIGLHDLQRHIQKMMEKYPTVNVHVEYRHAEGVYDEVLANAADIGLVAYPEKHPDLAIVPLGQDLLVFICHPQHPLARQKSVSLKSLAGQKLIGFEPAVPTRKALDRILRKHRVAVKYVMEFDNVETLKQAVQIDAGVAIVPQSTTRQEVAKKTLAVLPITEGNFYRPLAAIHKRNMALSPTLKQFLALFEEAA